eukprot:TRINITY_DN15714_c0_g1_i1.p1 TRINITY_DN15714_c0_g1~~TRINITY_DN15714_c0_g1_i1.p1  ORF type:complete len:600 (+),score=94.08 TRINITY_DN15714_c0_g1_i1:40-1800(+)
MAGSPPRYSSDAAMIGFDEPEMTETDSNFVMQLHGMLSRLLSSNIRHGSKSAYIPASPVVTGNRQAAVLDARRVRGPPMYRHEQDGSHWSPSKPSFTGASSPDSHPLSHGGIYNAYDYSPVSSPPARSPPAPVVAALKAGTHRGFPLSNYPSNKKSSTSISIPIEDRNEEPEMPKPAPATPPKPVPVAATPSSADADENIMGPMEGVDDQPMPSFAQRMSFWNSPPPSVFEPRPTPSSQDTYDPMDVSDSASNPQQAYSSEETKEKGVHGLDNMMGENNCFLNVVIQSLWHLKSFSSVFVELTTHTHKENCIVCELQSIFTQFQFAEDHSIPPRALRHALAALYHAEQRFQMGSLADATEAFDAILNAIHNCITGAERGEEKICNPSCVVHDSFALNVVETMECPKCKEQGEPFSYQEFVHYVPADALHAVSKMNRASKRNLPSILKYLDKQDLRVCPNEHCKAHNPLTRRLLNHPAVITIGLIWTSASSDRDEIEGVLSCLSTSFDSRELFEGSGSPAPARSTVYELKGAICYYGKHYVAFLNVDNVWMQFDDAAVRQIGSSWTSVTQKMIYERWQPNLLWYERK